MTDLQALRVAHTSLIKELMGIEQNRHDLRASGLPNARYEKFLSEKAKGLSEASDQMAVIIARLNRETA